jgi:hypothetical protein
VDPVLALGICLFQCVLFNQFKPGALIFFVGSLALLMHRRLGTINMIPIHNITIMVVGTYSFWLVWGVIMHDYMITNLVIVILHGIFSIVLSVACMLTANRIFSEMHFNAIIITAILTCLGLLPINLASSLDGVTLFAHTILYVASVYLLFFLRLKKVLSINTLSLFSFSLWILTSKTTFFAAIYLGVLSWNFFTLQTEHVPVVVADPEVPPKPVDSKKKVPYFTYSANNPDYTTNYKTINYNHGSKPLDKCACPSRNP